MDYKIILAVIIAVFFIWIVISANKISKQEGLGKKKNE